MSPAARCKETRPCRRPSATKHLLQIPEARLRRSGLHKITHVRRVRKNKALPSTTVAASKVCYDFLSQTLPWLLLFLFLCRRSHSGFCSCQILTFRGVGTSMAFPAIRFEGNLRSGIVHYNCEQTKWLTFLACWTGSEQATFLGPDSPADVNVVAGRAHSICASQFQQNPACFPASQPSVYSTKFARRILFLVAAQTLSHESRMILVAPESSEKHQQSLWSLREFQVLECCGGALRGANFLCQLPDRQISRSHGCTGSSSFHTSDLRRCPSPGNEDHTLLENIGHSHCTLLFAFTKNVNLWCSNVLVSHDRVGVSAHNPGTVAGVTAHTFK